ncbi:hypothetical protein RJ639_015644 [Escallonia herrerae]|uniref:Sodium/calcium exchanger membrane region domain-containing protein n=1 Tax=Escallonia herrerae TaxID=1293975 RepID=A0AA89AKQ2_9ASTE|nr:hypothetical protein RJ639_015644 [Escallonia herrerae]
MESLASTKVLLSLILNTSFIFLLSLHLITNLLSVTPFTKSPNTLDQNDDACTAFHHYPDYEAKCTYIKSHIPCHPKAYINFLEIFFCTCGRFPMLGYTILLLWFLLLIYLLGNTASDYFCPALENLSRVMNLPPTITGAILLPLGNGANDVFESIVSFAQSGSGEVGLNTVLGGAFFISSIVVGVICITGASREIVVDKTSFVRDVVFFLFSLGLLLLIILVGRINFWVAICFTMVYLVYVFVISITHFFYGKKERVVSAKEEFVEMDDPLLGGVDVENYVSDEKFGREEWNGSNGNYLGLLLKVLELPLYLPRRLTIPAVSEERWSRPIAITSVFLAPILIATLWNTQREDMGSKTSLIIYITSGFVGIVLASCAFLATRQSSLMSPPKKCLVLWLAGGFVMSITWIYIVAEELVSLLSSLGIIVGISPSILAVTLLAWGNSTGDLVGNVALATNGGPDGVQIAISGCYAGPLFNTLVGLGLSLVFSSWSVYPSSFVIRRDPCLYEIMGFLMGGLLWALVILPKKNMQLNRLLGGGLLAIYFCFVFLQLARALGWWTSAS